MAEIALRALSKRFGETQAVDELTTDFVAGAVTGFLGPNGAGKSTALRMALGLVRPTGGTALIGGAPYAELRHPLRTVGAVLEAGAFHPRRSGRNHLRLVARLGDLPEERVTAVLEAVDLTTAADRRVGGYSLGMRQRLSLATALLGDPEVLVLDEPANGLDPAGMAWLRGLLRGLADEGRTVVISSHILAEVAQTVDRLVILGEGRLRFAGTAAELTAYGETLERAFLRLTASPAEGAVA